MRTSVASASLTMRRMKYGTTAAQTLTSLITRRILSTSTSRSIPLLVNRSIAARQFDFYSSASTSSLLVDDSLGRNGRALGGIRNYSLVNNRLSLSSDGIGTTNATTITTSMMNAKLKPIPFSSPYSYDHHKSKQKQQSELINQLKLPQRISQKIVSADDAVELIRDGDTIAVSGFVAQGSPEAVLKALGQRFEETSSPNNLTLLFGGGPGDWGQRGLSHLGKEKILYSKNKDSNDEEECSITMLKRSIGGHYGQCPTIAKQALDNKIEAWALPMGSISRMIRAQSTHSPGHITGIGLGTMVDPDKGTGGAVNDAAKASPLHNKLVQKIRIEDNEDLLMYKALPINVAIIRGTTADSSGNITLEHESLLCDQKIIASATKNSGGIVIAQVKRIAADGSINSRQVGIPAPLVDCVVVVDEKDHAELHGMSYVEANNPSLTGEIKAAADEIQPMAMSERKIIARRSFLRVKPNKIINLGIGLPEGIASVAHEEGMLDYITLTTEPGVFGGLPASGHSFGPSFNATSLLEMNQMFDFYDGGGLDIAFLGAAQINAKGDVNVSRLSSASLTGPGGFIDISQSTRNICFLTTMTTKGLVVETPGEEDGGGGTLKIVEEGKIHKFVPKIYETTFSGDEAVRRGQKVMYVTERAVFQRSKESDTIELIEIAPGIDLQRDVLDQMDFTPSISPNLKLMDPRIFIPDEKMGITSEIFGSLEERHVYHPSDHTIFFDLFGVTLHTKDDVIWFIDGLKSILRPLVDEKGKINMVANYEGFDIKKGLEPIYSEMVHDVEKEMYKSVRRYAGRAFKRAKLKNTLQMKNWDPDELFDRWDVDETGQLSIQELRDGFINYFQVHLTPDNIRYFTTTSTTKATMDHGDREADDGFITTISREQFKMGMQEVFNHIW